MHTFSNQFKIVVGIVAGVGTLSFIYYRIRKSRQVINYLDILKELNESHVVMKDREIVRHKLNQLINGGKDKLLVLADFDRTISKYKENGQYLPTSHGVLEDTTHLPEAFVTASENLRDMYYPIEIDQNRTVAEKIPYIVEWYTKVHKLIIQYGFDTTLLTAAVNSSPIKLRDGFDMCVRNMKKKHMPLLIFSAGLGDIIALTLRREDLLLDNVSIVSNALDYNHNGIAVGFKHDVIHTFNKNTQFLKKSHHYDLLSKRSNVLLLGDSVSDAQMIDDSEASCVLRLGFLNEIDDKRLEDHLKVYDVVLIQNETMDVLNAILYNLA